MVTGQAVKGPASRPGPGAQLADGPPTYSGCKPSTATTATGRPDRAAVREQAVAGTLTGLLARVEQYVDEMIKKKKKNRGGVF